MIYLIKLFKNYSENDFGGLAAQTAFYLILSVFPLIFLFLSITAKIDIDMDTYFVNYILPTTISNFFESVAQTAPSGNSLTWVSILGTLWAASKSIYVLMKGISKAFTKENYKFTIKGRMMAVLLTAIFAVAIVSSFSILVMWNSFSDFVMYFVGYSESLLNIMRYMFSGLIIFLFVLFLYKFSFGRKINIKSMSSGALFVASGWILTSFGFEFYIKYFNKYATIFGGVGVFLGLVLWLFIISNLILVGAEINALKMEASENKA